LSREFKLQVIREIEAGKIVAQATREYQLRPNLIGRWQKQHREHGERSFVGAGHAYTQPANESAKIAKLERKVGQLRWKPISKKSLVALRDTGALSRHRVATPELHAHSGTTHTDIGTGTRTSI
jgi:transposase-like protein